MHFFPLSYRLMGQHLSIVREKNLHPTVVSMKADYSFEGFKHIITQSKRNNLKEATGKLQKPIATNTQPQCFLGICLWLDGDMGACAVLWVIWDVVQWFVLTEPKLCLLRENKVALTACRTEEGSMSKGQTLNWSSGHPHHSLRERGREIERERQRERERVRVRLYSYHSPV